MRYGLLCAFVFPFRQGPPEPRVLLSVETKKNEKMFLSLSHFLAARLSYPMRRHNRTGKGLRWIVQRRHPIEKNAHFGIPPSCWSTWRACPNRTDKKRAPPFFSDTAPPRPNYWMRHSVEGLGVSVSTGERVRESSSG